MTPRGHSAGPLAQLFPDLLSSVNNFCELLVWKKSWTVGNPLMCGENEADLNSVTSNTRLKNFSNSSRELRD